MTITKPNEIVKLPISVPVGDGVTSVTLVRDVYQPVELPVTAISRYLISVYIPTGTTAGIYDWYYGKNKGLIEIENEGATVTRYEDGTIVEYPDAVWGDMEYNTNNLINDETVNHSQTWSSQKIVDVFTAITATYSKDEIDEMMLRKADTANTYTMEQVDDIASGLQTTIDTKQDILVSGENIKTINNLDITGSGNITITPETISAYTKDEIDTMMARKADTADTYTKEDVDAFLSTKADTANTYTKAEVDELIDEIESSNTINESVIAESVVRNRNKILTKQDILVGGLNIQNINGVSLVQGGNRELVTPLQMDARSNQYYRRSTLDIASEIIVEAIMKVKGDTYTKDIIDALLALKADTANTYTKLEVDALIAAVPTFKYVVVSALPTVGEERTIYLVPISGSTGQDIYDEFLWIVSEGVGRYEQIGSTRIDLSNYYTKSETDSLLSMKADSADTYTKAEVDGFLSEKQDTLISGTNIKTINGQSVLGSGDIEVITPSGYTDDESIISEAVVRNRNKILTKQDILVGGLNIKNINGQSIVAGGNVELTTPLQLDARSNQYYRRETLDSASEVISEALYDLNDRVDDTYTKDEVDTLLNDKQDNLISGTNIKTINNESVLGNGNIDIVGTSGYTQDEGIVAEAVVRNRNKILTKQDILVGGLNIQNINGVSLVQGGNRELVTPLQMDARSNQYYRRTTLDTASEVINEALYELKNGGVKPEDVYTKDEVDDLISGAVSGKQDTLISGTNIKTINGISLLGSGNTVIHEFSEEKEEVIADALVTLDEKISMKADSADTYTKVEVDTIVSGAVSVKQDMLVSGLNIKKLNGNSILGSGNFNFNTFEHEIRTQEDYDGMGEGRDGNTLFIIDDEDEKGIKNLYLGDKGLDTVHRYELHDELNAKMDITSAYTKSETDSAITAAISGKVDVGTVYTTAQTDTLLPTKADKTDTYTKTEVDEIIEQLTILFDAKLELKQDTVTITGDDITTGTTQS